MISSGYTLKNIKKKYQVENEKITVLNNISLEIDNEDITVILGTSGCGKTTLLRAIAGIEDVDSGDIIFRKEGCICKPRIGFVFQESRLMYWLTVSENISLHSSNKKTDVDVDKYLEIMNLQKFRNAYPSELSGGMEQRVSVARALSFNPDMLFMDEPFSALDYFTRMDMQNEVIRIHESTSKGVVFVTHDIDEALTIGNKILVFGKDKKLVELEIGYGYDRDLTSEYFIEIKRNILRLLDNAMD